ncbi:MAG: hypothetical protein ACR2OI_02910, partial [Acidimicrobiia bacterium]
MRRKSRPAWRMLAVLLALALVASACGSDDDSDAGATTTAPAGATTTAPAGATTIAPADDMSGEPILVGHMTFHSGAFAEVGPWFDGAMQFVIDEINASPPLGRPLEQLSQDIGQIGEPQAARKLVEGDGVEILMGP